jgi:hypothetical protein
MLGCNALILDASGDANAGAEPFQDLLQGGTDRHVALRNRCCEIATGCETRSAIFSKPSGLRESDIVDFSQL